VADKSTQLILTALSRAAAAPAGAPLHETKALLGLFPNNAAGKQAAQRCQEDGYLCPIVPVEATSPPAENGGGTATLTKKKTVASPLCGITEKGLTYLLNQVSPREVLEDFVRALESRQKQADDLLTVVRQMRQSMDALKASADKVLQHTYRPETTPERGSAAGSLKALFASFLKEANLPRANESSPFADWSSAATKLHDVILVELKRWHGAGASEDYPLPQLFRQLPARTPSWTIGQFHDSLRQMHDLGQIYLHPWTGPLYEIPEPPYALLIGHEIAYYASIRK
jgi:hypothetical protein